MAELVRPAWGARRFSFVHPEWMVADFAERLRGLAPRIALLVDGLDEALAHEPFDGKWSIAQNVGHLADVEELWQERIEDLRRERATLTPAKAERFQAAAARHPSRPLAAIVAELAERRERLVAALDEASPELQSRRAFHERLQVPMRLVDGAQFAAEHDDHHLLRIRTIRAAQAGDGGAVTPPGRR